MNPLSLSKENRLQLNSGSIWLYDIAGCYENPEEVFQFRYIGWQCPIPKELQTSFFLETTSSADTIYNRYLVSVKLCFSRVVNRDIKLRHDMSV